MRPRRRRARRGEVTGRPRKADEEEDDGGGCFFSSSAGAAPPTSSELSKSQLAPLPPPLLLSLLSPLEGARDALTSLVISSNDLRAPAAAVSASSAPASNDAAQALESEARSAVTRKEVGVPPPSAVVTEVVTRYCEVGSCAKETVTWREGFRV